MDLKALTIPKIHQCLKKKEFSAVELAQAYLKRIKSEDKKIRAFLEVFEDLALAQSKEVDELISEGKEIPVLAGVPCAVKDNILIKGKRCTAGSKILENYTAPYDATVIKRLKRQKVVFLGKTNLDEFAMGSSTEDSAFQKTRNPHNLEYVPGGSSGGSAAAVANEQCCFALGSDTGGSIRQPASFCDVVGLKPTYGAVSRYGLIAFASSLDQLGPLAKTAEDCQIIFETIKGGDKKDSTSIDLNRKSKIQNLKIGVPKEYFGEGIDVGVKGVIEGIIKKTEKAGAKIEEISLPRTKYALACYYLIAPSEASANLARYDGIRYGMGQKGSEGMDLFEEYRHVRGYGFGPEVKRRIMLGTYVLSAGYYDAFYLKAQKVRTLLKRDFENAFRKVDAIFTPTSPFLPFKIGEKMDNPLEMYLSDMLTVPINLAGLPAISLPAGKIRGLPVGLQIIGPAFQETKLFEIAMFVENLG